MEKGKKKKRDVAIKKKGRGQKQRLMGRPATAALLSGARMGEGQSWAAQLDCMQTE